MIIFVAKDIKKNIIHWMCVKRKKIIKKNVKIVKSVIV